MVANQIPRSISPRTPQKEPQALAELWRQPPGFSFRVEVLEGCGRHTVTDNHCRPLCQIGCLQDWDCLCYKDNRADIAVDSTSQALAASGEVHFLAPTQRPHLHSSDLASGNTTAPASVDGQLTSDLEVETTRHRHMVEGLPTVARGQVTCRDGS